MAGQIVDNYQSKARQDYASKSREANKMLRVGRYLEDADKEPLIWENIFDNLGLGSALSGAKILDVGCGCGNFTDNMILLAQEKSLALTLVDFPEVMDALRSQYSQAELGSDISLIAGAFPDGLDADFLSGQRFDYILMYNMIQCSGQPVELIRAAARLLAPYGCLFVGDVPNVNRKGRFLASAKGRVFDAAYKKLTLEQLPVYTSHEDFVTQCQVGNTSVNDGLVVTVFTEFRKAGYDVFVLPQPMAFPFSFTREDILIRRYD
ncbi:MAG: class I SAM-dependent methyltransferase [Sulfuritalea sp.]|nr:class I SAM-dependent methyltransferase [Sulfuritalea sp.]